MRKRKIHARNYRLLYTILIVLTLFFTLCFGTNGLLASTITSVGEMTTARYVHKAIRLSDGRVLVVGGKTELGTYLDYDAYTILQAEVYDPSTKSFSPTGTQTTKRLSHCLVLLDNGKVLLAGGSGGFIFPELKSVELYDPATGTFRVVGDMSNKRIYNPTCTKLNDGKILIAGGAYEGGYATPWKPVDIYDPNANTLTHNVGSLVGGRSSHGTQLLPDGRVLIMFGGPGWGQVLWPLAEIYDPSTNTSTLTTGEPQYDRGDMFGSTLLSNGKIFIAGGRGRPIDNKYSEYYDHETGSFSLITGNGPYLDELPTFTIPVDSTKVAIIRGSKIDIFDTVTGTTIEDKDLSEYLSPEFKRIRSATKLLDGTVLLIEEGKKAFIYRYDTLGDYIFGGFQQPINADNSSIFKLGRTIPVKIILTDRNGQKVPTATVTISVTQITDAVLGTEVEMLVDASGMANSGNLFRYDAVSGEYIFNLSTKGYTKGTYRIYATPEDGQGYSVDFSLR